MTSEDVLQELERRPYVPLRLHLSSGAHLDVLYEWTAWVRQNTLLLVHPLARGTVAIGNYDVIALRLIERIEQLPRNFSGIAPARMQLQIRQASLTDAEIIASFNTALALETENVRLDASTILAGVRAALCDESKARYWIAEIDGRVVGQIMITHEWSDWRNGNIWWIQSVYVDQEFRRRGIFRALYEHVRQQAKEAGAVALRLYVDADNRSAQETYRSLGMRVSNYRVMGEKLDETSADEFE